MKAIIWIVCIVALSTCMVLIKNCGIILGGIPSALMFGGMLWLAKKLCSKLDEKRQTKDSKPMDEKKE